MKRRISLDYPTGSSVKPTTSADGAELELLRLVALRDRAALKDLYLLYHGRLSRFLHRLVHRQEIRDEIINDTMFIVWTSADRFRGDSRVSTWIAGIAYRRALKRLRNEQMDQVDFERADAPGMESVQNGEIREWLDRALSELPLQQRMCLEFCYVLGYSCDEIARISNCPVNTVKTRLFHARRKLRGSLPRLAGERQGRATAPRKASG